MIPFLTYPLALLALASLPALAAIYILRNRFRRRQVSSLLLWQFHIQSREGGSKIHRLQLPLLFFLELLALLLLVVAAAAPHWKLPQSTRPLIVVLDDSFSMRAVRDNVSAQERAREFLQGLFNRQAPPSTRLVLAGAEPRLLGAPVRTWAQVSELLNQWHCQAPQSSIGTSLTLASELGKQQANVLVLTDHAPEDKTVRSDRLEWHSFGAPLKNLAFVNASRTAYGEKDRCLLEVANQADAAQTTRLLVRSGTNEVQGSLISLGSHENQRFVFNVPDATPVLRATLDPDPLAEDNDVQLLPPIRKRIRVEMALTNSALESLVNRTLEATGLRAAISASPELVILDSSAIPAGSNSWSLRIVSSADATAYTGPFVIDTAHPLAQGIGLEGVIWAASNLTNATGEVPVILAGNIPLLSVREDVLGRRHITLNLNSDLSTLRNSPDWPSLFWNLLHWRATQTPGLLERNARLGTDVALKTTGGPVTVTWPDGSVKSFPKTGDQLALETPMPGVYSVAMGEYTNSFAVNPLAAEESDLSGCTTGQWGTWANDEERRMEEASVGWIFGLAALGLMTAHLYLLAAGKGGR